MLFNGLMTSGHVMAAQSNLLDALNKIKMNPELLEAYHEFVPKAIESLQYEHAKHALEKALSIDNNNVDTWFLLARYLEETGDVSEAVGIYKHLVELFPYNNQYQYHLGLILYISGQVDSGLSNFKFRPDTNAILSNPDLLNGPIAPGTHIYLTEEQGLGDQIMFLQFLDLLKLSEIQISVEIDQRLVPIYKNQYPTVSFFDRHSRPSITPDSIILPLGDLFISKASEMTNDRFKAPILDPFEGRFGLKPPSGNKLRVGLSWATVAQYGSLKRTIPLRSLVNQLDPGRHELILLQYLPIEDDIGLIRDLGFDYEIVANNYSDILGVSKAILSSDVVVTIDNYVLHLAGALGAETYGLIPFAPSYRWGLTSTTSKLYANVTLLRQDQLRDWSSPLDMLGKVLEKKVPSDSC